MGLFPIITSACTTLHCCCANSFTDVKGSVLKEDVRGINTNPFFIDLKVNVPRHARGHPSESMENLGKKPEYHQSLLQPPTHFLHQFLSR